MLIDKNRRTVWKVEISLLVGLVVSLLSGTWLSGQQRSLADRVVRLHVIGASDSAADQQAKLRARDAVLTLSAPLLEGTDSPERAMEVLSSHLEELARVSAQAAGTEARASLEENVWFPTKRYDNFALPAGRYPALRIALGEGEGRNWWCVVFPSLCLGSVTETAQETGSFTQRQLGLITGADGGYVIEFRALELWNELAERLQGQVKG